LDLDLATLLILTGTAAKVGAPAEEEWRRGEENRVRIWFRPNEEACSKMEEE
jgi:hypothetical protein